MTMPENNIQLTLKLAEINQILDALSQKPYVEVYQLINKIQQQAQNQLEAATSDLRVTS